MTSDLTPANGGDGFGVVENKNNQFIIGKMLKFVDGDFIVDKTSTLPIGTTLVAIGVVTAWVKWQDGKPANPPRVTYPGMRHPSRDELPDQDEKLWEAGLNGDPADPWKDTRYLRLINEQSGADFTFITDSVGGRKAVGVLKSQIMNVRMAHPNALPVVQLASGSFKTSYGQRKCPEFVVVGWRGRDGGLTIDQPPPQLAPPKARVDLDDEIPF